MPAALAYLWAVFVRLHNRRGSTGFGPAPLSWTEFDAFVRLSGCRLAPWEIEIIEACDREYLKSVAERRTKKT